MATYVNDLRLKEISTGDESGTWGTSTNTNLELIGEALGYATEQSFGSDADATTTVADGASDPARAMYFKVTSAGSLTATRTLTIAPNTVSRVMFIENATSGSQSIAISQGSGANVTIATGKTAIVYLDGAGSGAAVVDAMAGVDPGVTDTLAEVLTAGNTSSGTNIELTTTDKVQFRDSAIYINSSADGQLDIVADTEVQIAATTVDINGNVDISGAVTAAGLTVDTTTLVVDASNNRVGIGTSSPSAKLTVVGTTKVGEGAASNTSKLMVNTASGTAAGIQLFQDSVESWIIDNPASSTGLTFSNSGTERMRIDASGNVGIGTSSVTNALGWASVAQVGGANPALSLKNTSNVQWDIANFGGSFAVYNGSNQRLRIDSSGNVSVSSSAGLVENAIGVFMLPAGELRVKDSTEDGTAQISTYNNNVTSDAEQFFVGNNLGDVDIGNKRGALKFFASSTTERMRIDTSGNLLVGKTATAVATAGTFIGGGSNVGLVEITRDGNHPLRINRTSSDGQLVLFDKDGTNVASIACRSSGGNLQIHTNQSGIDFGGDGYLPMRGSTITDNSLDIGSSSFRFKDLYLSSAVKFGSQDALTTDGTSNYLKSGSAIYFQPSNSQSMLLDSAGRLLIGGTGTSFGERLTVNNNGAPYSAHLFAGSGATAPLIVRNANGVSGSRSQIIFYYDANARGSITSTSSATAYNTSSDQRLKENIADADDAGSRVDAIQVRSFDWKVDGSHQKYGMIAQELQSVAPEAVSAPEDPEEMMGVDYSKLVPMLVKEIQSLRARVQQLEAE